MAIFPTEPILAEASRQFRGSRVQKRRFVSKTPNNRSAQERHIKSQETGATYPRTRSPERIAYEIAGHVLFYFLVRWMPVEAATPHGQDPFGLSFTQAIRELQDMSRTPITASPQRVSRVLLPRLLIRIAEHVVPARNGRHYPRPYDTKVRITGSGKRLLPNKLPTDQQQGSNTCKKVA